MRKQMVWALTLILTAGVPATRATPVQWTISNTILDDGGTITGTFTFDADTTTLSHIAVSTTAGTAFSGASYPVVPTTATYQPNPGALFFTPQLLPDYTGSTLLFFQLFPPLGDWGEASSLLAAEYRCLDATCLSANPLRTGKGAATPLAVGAAVPEPSMAGLLAGSLGLLALWQTIRFASNKSKPLL